ncbi:MAG: sugar ABC transporter permease [Clostridiales bacterium]|nr:sugar ABC transporter permease [Clostridiales bacterium]
MKEKSKKSWFSYVEPYLYLVPALVLFILFVFWPFIKTIQLSFARTTTLGQVSSYIGIQNYVNIFTDSGFWNSLLVTLRFAVVRVVFSIGLGFVLAIISTEKIKGKNFFRTIYALPMAISAAAASVVFMFIFHSSLGILNRFLGTNIGWLTDKNWAWIAVSIVSVWMAIGMNFIYLTAAIQSVSADLYESAALDGANFFQKHLHVTIPGISPTLFFLLIINVINAVQAYAEVKMMTQGGPAESTNNIVYEIYAEAFINSRFGVACAESVILFIILMILTALQFRLEKVVTY